MSEEILARIQNYLEVGGLFNPEMMEHDKVRTLIMDCRTALAAAQERVKLLEAIYRDCGLSPGEAEEMWKVVENQFQEIIDLKAQLKEREGVWRLLEVGEQIQDGDEFYHNELWHKTKGGKKMEGTYALHRRRMSKPLEIEGIKTRSMTPEEKKITDEFFWSQVRTLAEPPTSPTPAPKEAV